MQRGFSAIAEHLVQGNKSIKNYEKIIERYIRSYRRNRAAEWCRWAGK